MRLSEETALHRRQRYAKALRDIANRYDRLDDTTIRRLTGLLQQLRKDIAARLIDSPTDFELWRLTEIKRNIEEQITLFQSRLTGEISDSFRQSVTLGADNVLAPLRSIGINVAFNVVQTPILNVALDFSAMLVQNISDDLRRSIDSQLRLAALNQETPFQVMKRITAVMGVNAYDGVWGVRRRPDVVRGVAARAEAIVRTELTRMFNLASTSTANEAKKHVPGLLKRWIATGDRRTRPSHLNAHLRYMQEPIPVDQPFIVGGAKMDYPGDPKGGADETIHCRCRVENIVPEIGVIPTPQDLLVREEKNERRNKNIS